MFLFQLLCVRGQWERALDQLKVAGRARRAARWPWRRSTARRCAARRSAREVFAGKRSPMVFGEPEQWVALLIEALLVAAAAASRREAAELRRGLRGGAGTSPGTIDGQPFDWIADADSRLGPVLEAMIDGRYYWVPFERLRAVEIEAPGTCATWSGCPPTCSSPTAARSSALIPDALPRLGGGGRRADRAGAQDRVGRRWRRTRSRPRPAHVRHRRGRVCR